jgi:hypothetical protein
MWSAREAFGWYVCPAVTWRFGSQIRRDVIYGDHKTEG